MSSFRDKLNVHLPIALQLISSLSLVILALCAICASKSLKSIAETHSTESASIIHGEHIFNGEKD
ncbi:putative protein family PM-10 [Prochlorococcus sp. MIT 0602]|uniref:hypothetical protein n=1 Tax=Prochlorococcus sp. MIT 0603 TaxID=1499500 RepID=UPI0005337BB3|nr:hypothetical protein [Prochlorococcus sp. MIT 0603]KGG15028.1 putative protein family PM-10 [Prochlorococcus sp. MIT 0602]KGG17299.1 putative protein family PM-10 [Prochlorococcus sp. MIT 0603]